MHTRDTTVWVHGVPKSTTVPISMTNPSQYVQTMVHNERTCIQMIMLLSFLWRKACIFGSRGNQKVIEMYMLKVFLLG
jgi:hypothetical protein